MISKTFKNLFLIFSLLLIHGCGMSDSCNFRNDGNDVSNNSMTTLTFSVDVHANGNYTVNQVTDNSTSPATTKLSPDNSTIDNFNHWLKSNVKLKKGQAFTISVTGMVGMCASTGISGSMSNGSNGKVINIDASNPNWIPVLNDQNQNAYIRTGDAVSITVNSPSSAAGSAGSKYYRANSKPNPVTWSTDPNASNKQCANGTDTNCWFVNGTNLQAYIGASSPSPSDSGTLNLDKPYDSARGGAQQGRLFLRVTDPFNNYSQNQGGYAVNVLQVGCPARNGQASVFDSSVGQLIAMISDQEPDKTIYSSDPAITVYDGSAPESSFTPSIAGKDGYLWFRVNNYTDFDAVKNVSGSYNVKIAVSAPVDNTPFSQIIANMLSDMRNIILDSAKYSFQAITCSGGNNTASVTNVTNTANTNCSNYLSVIRNLLVLYIALYGIMFSMGLLQINQFDLVMRLIKLGLVFTLLSNQSWQFFYNYFFRAFLDGIPALIGYAVGGSSTNPFAFMDRVMQAILFNPTTILKLLALIFASPLGIIYLLAILIGLFEYLKAMLKAVISYAMSIMAVGLLIILAPIYIPFVLFQVTRPLFDKWIAYLVRYSLSPVVLIIGINILHSMLEIVMENLLNYSVCYRCAFSVSIPFLQGVPPLFCLSFFMPFGVFNNGMGIPFSAVMNFPLIIQFIVLTKMLRGYATFSEDIMVGITGTFMSQGAAIAGSGSKMEANLEGMKNEIKKPLGLDQKSKDARKSGNEIREKAHEKLLKEEQDNKVKGKDNKGNDIPDTKSDV